MQNVSAIEVPGIHDAFEISQRPVGLGPGKPHFDARRASSPSFQFARSAESDHISMIDDSYAVTEAFGLLDVMRGHENGFFVAFQFLDDVIDFSSDLGIETRGRFVEK